MVLSFRPQFVPKILDGTKIHTIRENAGNRWKKGNLINMATGVRTPYYNEFSKRICCGTQKIEIKTNEYISQYAVFVDGKQMDIFNFCELSKNDGFDSVHDFRRFFPTDFIGTLIHWTNKLY